MEGCAGDERNTQRLVREGCKVRDHDRSLAPHRRTRARDVRAPDTRARAVWAPCTRAHEVRARQALDRPRLGGCLPERGRFFALQDIVWAHVGLVTSVARGERCPESGQISPGASVHSVSQREGRLEGPGSTCGGAATHTDSRRPVLFRGGDPSEIPGILRRRPRGWRRKRAFLWVRPPAWC